MASIHRETLLSASADEVWASLREVGNVHRLFPGVLVDARLEGDVRVVTFASGRAVRERIVAIDEARRRVAYAVLQDGLVHHSASMQVLAENKEGSRFVWISDLLPDDLATSFSPVIDEGMAALKRALEPPARHSCF
jgi:Polyketide cyclase / dehydrase and lipid transport